MVSHSRRQSSSPPKATSSSSFNLWPYNCSEWNRQSLQYSIMLDAESRSTTASSSNSNTNIHPPRATARTIAGSVAIYWITVSLIPIYNKYFFKKQFYPFPIATAGIQLAGVALLLGVVNSLENALVTQNRSRQQAQAQQQTPSTPPPSWILGPHLLYKLSWCFPIGILFGLKYGVTNWGLDLLPAPTHLLLQSTDLVWTVLTAWLINQERIRPLESLCLVGCILGSFVLGWSHVITMEEEEEHDASQQTDMNAVIWDKHHNHSLPHVDDPLYSNSNDAQDEDDDTIAQPWLAIGVNLLSPMLLGLCISTLRLATVELMRPDNCVHGKVSAVELTCLKLILSSAVATALAIWLEPGWFTAFTELDAHIQAGVLGGSLLIAAFQVNCTYLTHLTNAVAVGLCGQVKIIPQWITAAVFATATTQFRLDTHNLLGAILILCSAAVYCYSNYQQYTKPSNNSDSNSHDDSAVESTPQTHAEAEKEDNSMHDDDEENYGTERQHLLGPRTATKQTPRWLWTLLVLALSSPQFTTASSANNNFVVRIRQTNGMVQRVGLDPGKAPQLTLRQVVQDFMEENDEDDGEACYVQIGGQCIPLSNGDGESTKSEAESTLKSLGVRHGSLLTLIPPGRTNKGLQKKPKEAVPDKSSIWHPYPDLAKDYQRALRQIRRRANAASYSQLSTLHRSLHVVEAQPTGPLYRLYLCSKAAERFASHPAPRAAMLWGTIHRERQDLKRARHKTSLSSTTEAGEMCQVAKVQAIWESSDCSEKKLAELLQDHRLRAVADGLGLTPVGWIFSYPDERHENEDSLPVYARDIATAARLQIQHMQNVQKDHNVDDNSEYKGFCTVAMHSGTGATEVFQMSNVAVQMVSQDMFVIPDKKNERFVETAHAVLVDGRETTNLDSVLCLVNTALVSHSGTFVGDSSHGTKKANPFQITKKTRKSLTKALTDKDDTKLLGLLCNFNILVALYEDVGALDMTLLLETVRKYSRGQKKSTKIDASVRRKLEQVLPLA